ncbi:MAG: hypothetical protein CMN79_02470 [Spirochaetales bacterium]|nr:hypothetical protein [Spirochaetales bacterium]
MTNLKLDSADLRKIFKNSITVKDISSQFVYQNGDKSIKFIIEHLISNDYLENSNNIRSSFRVDPPTESSGHDG